MLEKITEHELKITRTENGYICTNEWEDTGYCKTPMIRIERRVFEEDDSDDGEQKCFADMLYYVGEFFGHTYDKYRKKNLRIDFKKVGRDANYDE